MARITAGVTTSHVPAIGAALDLPIALITLPGWPPLASATPAAWWGLVYLTFVSTILALAFQNLALHRLDASQVATFGNAAPLLTVLWGVWLFGETVSPALALGGLLTLGGIFWTGRNETTAAEPASGFRPQGLVARAATPLSRP